MAIDSRMLDSSCQANIDENFSRTLALVDEGGSGSGGLVVNVTTADGTQTFDKTWNEIKAVIAAGGSVELKWSDTSFGVVTGVYGEEGAYSVYNAFSDAYTASTADGYPAYGEEDNGIS